MVLPQLSISDLVDSPREALPHEEWMGWDEGRWGQEEWWEEELELVCKIKYIKIIFKRFYLKKSMCPP